MNFCRPRRLSAPGCLLLLLVAFWTPPARAQFSVENVEFRSDGRLELNFPGDANSYYRLLTGEEVTSIVAPVALGLTPPLAAPASDSPVRFYRVQQVPRAMPMDSDGDQIPDVYELESEFLNGLNPLDAVADPDGNGRSALQEYLDSIDDGKLVTISSSFPIAGETGVSVNRETVVHFSSPIAPNSIITSSNFFAGFGGRKFLSRIELAADRRKATLFYQEPIPGSVRITAVFDATGIKDARGREIDADGDGQPGGLFLLQFDTYSTTPIENTAISGTVFASEPVPNGAGGFTNRPIPGVTITVDGAEETMRAVTGANGQFTLSPCPAGRFFVHIDGRTSPLSAWPNGAYYPNIGKAWTAQGGRNDNLAPGEGVIFLPLIPAETLKPVSLTQDTEIRLSPDAVAANPALAGVKILVPANSLFDNDGRRGGMVGIAMVDPERLPEPLPPGLTHLLDITVQSDGGQNFDRPVPACFPNVPNREGFPMAPGARAVLMSFNHDTGKWETVGGMTVSDDGKLVCTDPGVGIRQPGWHGMEGPPPVTPPPAAPFPPTQPTFPDQVNDCKNVTDPNCASRCDGQNNADIADCNQTYEDKRNRCIANGQIGGDCADAKLAAERDECIANSRAKRKSCQDGCVKQVCSGGGGPTAPSIARASTPAEQASALLDQISALYAAIGDRAPTAAERAQIDGLLAEVRAITGPDASAFWAAARSAGQAIADANNLFNWGARSYPIYRASFNLRSGLRRGTLTEFELNWRSAFIRQSTEAFGQYQVFLPISASGGMDGSEGQDAVRIDDWFYDARTRSVGRSSVKVSQVGFLPRFLPGATLVPLRSRLSETSPLLPLFADEQLQFINTLANLGGAEALADLVNAAITALDGRDTDNDGLADLAEFIIGTDPRKKDTDGDGLMDGAEIDQGLNPLDGRRTPVGVIGAVPVQGEAVDVAAFNDRAVVALKSGGVGIFDVAAERLGVLIARLDAPGAVKVAALSQEFAVAGGDFEGLLIVDPQNPSGLRRVFAFGSVTATAVEGGFAWIGTASSLLLFMDLATGNIIDSVELPSPPSDIALDGGLVTVVLNQQLLAFEQFEGEIVPRGQINLGLSMPDLITGRRRLAVGDGTAFATDLDGFSRFDVSNPLELARISQRQSYGPASFKQILPTGSGYGLAVVGSSPVDLNPTLHNVQIFDLRNPAANNNAGLIIRTPGAARAASIYNGLAYVADGFAGLQIVNFLASDIGAVPPTISLRTSTTAGRAEEGQLLRLTAAVADDVLVRAVEFFVDGERLASDGNFPFEVALRAPLRSDAKTNILVRARAFDTGGNATWSDEQSLELIPDATAPRLLRVTPGSGELLPSVTSILALFSEPLDAQTITPATIQLRGAGLDGLFGSADDRTILDYSLELRDAVPSVALTLHEVLPPGAYRLTFTPQIKDLAGNPLAADVNIDITLFDKTIDTDGDGLPDGVEILLGLDPLRADTNNNGVTDGQEDADGDGLRNAYEIEFGLNPLRRDTNGNGVGDGEEDRDLDGLNEKREQAARTNPLLADTDADGWSDEAELTAGSNPLSAASTPKLMTVGQPPVDIIAPRAVFGAGQVFGTTVAQPTVETLAPRVVFDDRLGFGTTLAQPPVEILAPRVVLDGGFGFGVTVARPPVEVLAPRVVFGHGVSFGPMLAQPPVEIIVPRVVLDGSVGFGTTLAQPPLSIEMNP